MELQSLRDCSFFMGLKSNETELAEWYKSTKQKLNRSSSLNSTRCNYRMATRMSPLSGGIGRTPRSAKDFCYVWSEQKQSTALFAAQGCNSGRRSTATDLAVQGLASHMKSRLHKWIKTFQSKIWQCNRATPLKQIKFSTVWCGSTK